MTILNNVGPEGAVIHWDDLRTPATAVFLFTSFPPTSQPFIGGTRCLRFDSGLDRQVFLNVQMAHAQKTGFNIRPHVHWGPDATNVGTQTIRWAFEYTFAETFDTFSNPSTTIYADDTGTFLDRGHYVVGFPEIDMSAVDSVSSMFICRLYRNGASGTDTLAANAFLYEFDIHVALDAPGSGKEFSK